MTQQTAVDWLIEQVKSEEWQEATIKEWIEAFEQAKAMEKEQIIKAFESQKNCVEKYYEYAEQYYTETYNK